MDPLSISMACITVLGAIASTTKVLKDYASNYRETRNDIAAVLRDVAEFGMVLEMLRDDTHIKTSRASGPPTLARSVLSILSRSEKTLVAIEELLEKHAVEGTSQSAWWMLSGKAAIGKLQSRVSQHRAALGLALDVANNQAVSQIVTELERLRLLLIGQHSTDGSSLAELDPEPGGEPTPETQFYEEMNDYAETVLGSSSLLSGSRASVLSTDTAKTSASSIESGKSKRASLQNWKTALRGYRGKTSALPPVSSKTTSLETFRSYRLEDVASRSLHTAGFPTRLVRSFGEKGGVMIYDLPQKPTADVPTISEQSLPVSHTIQTERLDRGSDPYAGKHCVTFQPATITAIIRTRGNTVRLYDVDYSGNLLSRSAGIAIHGINDSYELKDAEISFDGRTLALRFWGEYAGTRMFIIDRPTSGSFECEDAPSLGISSSGCEFSMRMSRVAWAAKGYIAVLDYDSGNIIKMRWDRPQDETLICFLDAPGCDQCVHILIRGVLREDYRSGEGFPYPYRMELWHISSTSPRLLVEWPHDMRCVALSNSGAYMAVYVRSFRSMHSRGLMGHLKKSGSPTGGDMVYVYQSGTKNVVLEFKALLEDMRTECLAIWFGPGDESIFLQCTNDLLRQYFIKGL